MQFKTFFRVVFHETAIAVFNYRYKHFKTSLDGYVSESMQMLANIDNKIKKLENKIELFNEYVSFAKSLNPSNDVSLKDIMNDSAYIFYASAIIIKVYLIEDVKKCVVSYTVGDIETEIDIILNLSQSFLKRNVVCNCAEKCAQSFICSLVKGEGEDWLSWCCRRNFSSMYPLGRWCDVSDIIITSIKTNIQKINNVGIPYPPSPSCD